MRTELLRQRRLGFSVYSLIVILAVLALLIGLLLPAIQAVRRAAARMQSANNIKQMTLGLHSVQDVYKKLPPAVGWFPTSERRNPGWVRPAGHGTVFYHLLPFIESGNVYNRTAGSSWTSFNTVNPIFIAPLDATAPSDGLHHHNRGAISYAANAYVLTNLQDWQNARFAYDARGFAGRPTPMESRASLPKITVQDGTSNTIIFAERFATCSTPIVNGAGKTTGWRRFERVWGESSQNYNHFAPVIWRPLVRVRSDGTQRFPPVVPPELMPQFGANIKNCEPGTWQALDPNIIQVGIMDGSVRSVGRNITQETWTNALRPDDGMVLGADW